MAVQLDDHKSRFKVMPMMLPPIIFDCDEFQLSTFRLTLHCTSRARLSGKSGRAYDWQGTSFASDCRQGMGRTLVMLHACRPHMFSLRKTYFVWGKGRPQGMPDFPSLPSK